MSDDPPRLTRVSLALRLYRIDERARKYCSVLRFWASPGLFVGASSPVVADIEESLARLAVAIIQTVDDLKDDLKETKERLMPTAIERELNRLGAIIRAQIKRWEWSYVLNPDGEARIRARLERYRHKREAPFLRAVLTWRSKPNLEPDDFADAMKDRAERLGLKPLRLSTAVAEKRALELREPWLNSPALGRERPAVASGEAEDLERASAALRSFAERCFGQDSPEADRLERMIRQEGIRPLPTPASILGIADITLRQRATDAWTNASRLPPTIDFWRNWFYLLKTSGDADPSLAILLYESVRACLTSLCRLGVNSPTFHQNRPEELLGRFPMPPSGILDPPWQTDQEYLRQTEGCFHVKGDSSLSALQGELWQFMENLKSAPSVAFAPARTNLAQSTEAIPPTGGENLNSSRPKNARKRGGRPPDSDSVNDRRIADAWSTKSYKLHADLAKALGMPTEDVKAALDRNRHRRKCDGKTSP